MSSEKNWNRPWSTQELIDHADNWSLAGDVALLNNIKHFANNLLSKTDELNSNVDNVMNDLGQVGLKLDILQNEFQSLKNTQFVESRVYEDDETLDSNDMVSNSNFQKDELKQDINLTMEIELLDNFYEMVEIDISDSEDDSEKSFILKPKDMYENRPLPPIIGSDEWYKNWYLEDDHSDIDSHKSEEIYSESDSEDNLPKDLYTSESSSELEFSRHVVDQRNAANSTLKVPGKKPDLVYSSEESEDPHSLPTKVQLSNKTFAEQLTAKLDTVISKEENVTREINTKPIKPSRSDTFPVDLFCDEPPPLNDSEDKTVKHVLSSERNLFDDDLIQDSLFWNNQNTTSQMKNEKVEDTKVIRSDNGTNVRPTPVQISKGLFDSDISDDDELFTPKTQIRNTYLPSRNPTVVPLLDNEPPTLEEQSTKKKPIGGVSVLGNNTNEDISNVLKKKLESRSSEKSNSQIIQRDDDPQKKRDLFDEDLPADKPKFKTNNLFEDEFKGPTQKNEISNLFDESDSDEDIFKSFKKSVNDKNVQNKKYDLFGDGLFDRVEEYKSSNKSYTTSIFDDIDERYEEKGASEQQNSPVKNLRLFDELEKQKKQNDSFSINEEEEQLVTIREKESNNPTSDVKKSKTISLFDDDVDDDDDLFSSVTTKINFKLFDEPEREEKQTKTPVNFEKIQDDNKQHYKDDPDSSLSVISSRKRIKSETESLFATDDGFVNEETLESLQIGQNTITQSETEPSFQIYDEFVKKTATTGSYMQDVDTDNGLYKPPLAEKPRLLPHGLPIVETSSPPLVATVKPVVNLFSSTPPPEDDDGWDTRSDTFSDTDDFLSYTTQQNINKGSILFDNEPPPVIEPSGFMKNENSDTTSIDVDVSSIRHQSSDNLLITKSKLTMIPRVESISEESKMAGKEEEEELGKDIEENLEKQNEPNIKVKTAASITEMLKNPTQTDHVDITAHPPPRKLKRQNININVNALLPGSSRLKIQSVTKSGSLNLPENVVNVNNDRNESADKFNNNENAIRSNSHQFDQLDDVDVLHSITKERVRIPIKRRPSTRKGRQESLRKSTIEGDASYEVVVNSILPNINTNNSLVVSTANIKAVSPIRKEDADVSEKVSEDDSLDSAKIFKDTKTVPQNYKNEKGDRIIKSNLFDSDSNSDSAAKEDDLFKSSNKIKKKTDKDKIKKSRKSLFGDSSSDEEDLFAALTGSGNKTEDRTKVSNKKIWPAIKRLDNVETVEDPLTNLY